MPEEGKTTSSSLGEKLRSINIQQLPKTVSDAIKFTYRLGVPFLWVDALCIVQDDESDWKREATLMGSIYAMAFVTVAAASSSDCEGGFLEAHYDAREIHVPMGRLRGSPKDVINYLAWGREFSSIWTRTFVTNPLFSRGWTLQERELSPRIIHFTKQFVILECRERVCAYIRPLTSWKTLFEPKMYEIHHVPGLAWPYRCLDMPPSTKILGSMQIRRAPSPITFDTWRRLVEEFSRRHLTVASDKIPAIIGIAETLKDTFKCDVLAGLWRDNLLKELLWYRSGLQIVHPELDAPTDYAPSWSWAWTNFPIKFFDSDNDDVDDAEVLQANITEKGVKNQNFSGFIVLRARVVDVSTRVSANVILDGGNQYDSTPSQSFRSTEHNFTVCILRRRMPIADRWTGGGTMRGNEIPVEKIPGSPECGIGLVLRKIDDELPIYRRVGIIERLPIQYFESLEHCELRLV